MKVRRGNGEWLWTGNWGAVREIGVVVVFKLSPRIGERRNHRSVRGENGNRSRRGPVNGKEGAIGGELTANFFFFNVEKASDMFDHLFMGESHF